MIRVLMIIAALIAGTATAAPSYSVRSLTEPNASGSLAYSLNNSGVSVGYTQSVDGQRLLATRFGGSPAQNTDLGGLGGQLHIAYGINNIGQIVGYGQNSSGQNRALLFDPLGALPTDLGAGVANGLNELAQVVGYSFFSSDRYSATLFHTDGGAPTNLATLQGGFSANIGTSYAAAINAHSDVVGVWQDGLGGNRAALFQIDSGTKSIFGTLGGTTSVAQDINDFGQIVGYSTLLGDAVGRATIFSQSDFAPIELGSLGGNYGFANAINNLGQIVGSASTNTEELSAFLWTSGIMQDLNTLVSLSAGTRLVAATDINDRGVITALAQDLGGNRWAVLLEPNAIPNDIPEPASMLLVCIGLLAVVGVRKRTTKILR